MTSRIGNVAALALGVWLGITAEFAYAQDPPTATGNETTDTDGSDAASTEPPAGAGARFQRPGYRRPGEPELRRPVFRRAGDPRPEPVEREVYPPPLPAVDYDYVSVPDRWRIVESLGIHERLWDPYHQSTLKGDRPIFGTQDWFFNLAVCRPRSAPRPTAAVGRSTSSATTSSSRWCRT